MIEKTNHKIPVDVQVLGDFVKTTQTINWNCIICLKETRGRGIFVPHENQRNFFGLTGDETTIVYAICEDHTSQNTKMEDITQALKIH